VPPAPSVLRSPAGANPGRGGTDPGRRRLLTALLGLPVAGATTGLTGCTDERSAPSRDGRVELSVFWWGGANRAKLTEQALRLYSARNPLVSFRVTWQGNSGYYERLATQATGGNVPDLFQIDDNFLTEYAQRDIVLDLTPYRDDHRLDLRELPDGLVRYSEVEGRTMAVAGAQNSPGLIYNRSLLRRLEIPEPRIGTPYPEYLEWAQRVTQASSGRVAGTMDPSADYKALWLWLRSRGGELYQGRQLGFRKPDLIDWLELWQEARASRATPSAALIQQANAGDPSRQLVVTGQTATSFMWSNQLAEMQQHSADELALTSYPGPPAAQWARASMFWVVYRGSRHPDLAVDVINFLINDPEAGRVLGTERGLNANLAVRRSVQGTITDESMRRSAAFEAAMAGRFGQAPAPPPQGHATIRKLLVVAAESVQSGRSPIRTAVDRFLEQADAALAG
jgi:multiple sugar transport system substrate-binding protein